MLDGANDGSLLDAYRYAERGVYRPGERVRLIGLIRRLFRAAQLLDALVDVLAGWRRPDHADADGAKAREIVFVSSGLGAHARVFAVSVFIA